MIHVELPLHLRLLTKVDGSVQLDVTSPVTTNSILDGLEARYPMLCGTIREADGGAHRPLIRFFAGDEDVTHLSPDTPLPDSIANGSRPFLIVGAIAGG